MMKYQGDCCSQSRHIIVGWLLPVCLSIVWGNSANAQVIPDGTLPSTVNSVGADFTITGGAVSGTNLYHSFSQFSIPTSGSASFSNAINIENIFARVTGGSASNIDGLLQTNGAANLFLLNPSGILFGPNASLNIGGSLVASTAESVIFEDGSNFGVNGTTSSPLLTVSTPIGLQMGTTAGPIEVQGTPADNFFFRAPTLSTAPTQTLGLVGGQVDLNSASVSAPDGHVELWALQNGTVSIPTSSNWQLADSSTAPTWGDITLREASSISTSGADGGAINIRGRGLTLQDGSNIQSSTGTNGQGQGITVQTTEFVDLLGISDPANYVPPGLTTSVTGSGSTAGNITVDTQRLRLTNSAWISSLNYGFDFFTFSPIANAKTGDITIRATDVEVGGNTPFPNPATGVFVSSAITTLVGGGQQNNSGDITVEAERVRLLDGGRISTDLLGSLNFFTGQPNTTTGTAGDISVTATESLELRGLRSDNFTSAIISSIQNFAEGQGGNITVNAGQFILAEGGTISSAISGNPIPANAGSGIAGNIKIQATDVQVSDAVIDAYSQGVSGITVSVGQNASGQGGTINLGADRIRVFNGGQITSSSEGSGPAGNVNLTASTIDVQGVSPSLVNGQSLPSSITAAAASAFDAGSVNLTADALTVRDRGQVTVSNAGSGNAGNLNATARNVLLDNGGSLRAEVNGGSQGNINLRVDEVLLLRRGSNITTNAQGASTGGNINIDAGFVVAVDDENSDIVANAVLGSGGNININTQGIFGLEFRDQLTPQSDITASSEFGVSGTVNISNPDIDPDSGIIELPSQLVDASDQIASGCADVGENTFVATGRGGVPPAPGDEMASPTWNDTRDLSGFVGQGEATSEPVQPSQSNNQITEITGWLINPEGQVELIATASSETEAAAYVTCSTNGFK